MATTLRIVFLFFSVSLLIGCAEGEMAFNNFFAGVSKIRLKGGACTTIDFELSVTDKTVKGSYFFYYSEEYLRALSCIGGETRSWTLPEPTPIPEKSWNEIIKALSELKRVDYPGTPTSGLCADNPADHTWSPFAMQLDDSAWYSTSEWACQALVIPPGNDVIEELTALFQTLGPILMCYGSNGEGTPCTFKNSTF